MGPQGTRHACWGSPYCDPSLFCRGSSKSAQQGSSSGVAEVPEFSIEFMRVGMERDRQLVCSAS